MSENRKAILAVIIACVIWGLSGIYYKLIAEVPPLEVLCHRTLWSFVFFLILIAFQNRLGEAAKALGNKRTVMFVCAAAVAISLNWFGFIYAIQTNHALDASMGYYIFPMVAVFLGFIFYKEKLRPAQRGAVGLALTAIALLAYGLDVTPWIPLFLATSFGIYGLLKKAISIGPVLSVFLEVLILLPVALFWLYAVHSGGATDFTKRVGGYFGSSLEMSILLMFSGVMTGLPLFLFSYASKRLPYATIGILQYINPTLQFIAATLLFGEPITSWHMLAFPLIWAGVVIYSLDLWRFERSSKRAGIKRSTEFSTLK